MTTESIQRGQTEARIVLSTYNLKNLPIDVMEIAKTMGYDVYDATFKKDGLSGGIKFKTDTERGQIYCAKYDPFARRRFTIAHEIGHSIMHRDNYEEGMLETIDMFRNAKDHSAEEIEANAFAAELLMPADMVRKEWARWGSTEILADVFFVSLSAISYRLYNLGFKEDW